MTDTTDTEGKMYSLAINAPQPLNITFTDGSQLIFPVSGKASFTGDVEESARVFFDAVIRHRDSQLEAERQRAAGSEEELHKALHREKAAERKLLAAQDSIGVLEGVIARKEFDSLKGEQVPVALSVWYGSMPESNGKENWTAIIHRKGDCISEGITIDRSEYPERVRYEADRMRCLIGEMQGEPDILTYDANKRSDYVCPVTAQQKPVLLPDKIPAALYQLLFDECGGFVECDLNTNKVWQAFKALADGGIVKDGE